MKTFTFKNFCLVATLLLVTVFIVGVRSAHAACTYEDQMNGACRFEVTSVTNEDGSGNSSGNPASSYVQVLLQSDMIGGSGAGNADLYVDGTYYSPEPASGCSTRYCIYFIYKNALVDQNNGVHYLDFVLPESETGTRTYSTSADFYFVFTPQPPPPVENATLYINVDSSCSSASWYTSPSGSTGSGAGPGSYGYVMHPALGGTTYTLTPYNVDRYKDTINSDGGGSAMTILPGQTKSFTIRCNPVVPPQLCEIDTFNGNTPIEYNSASTLTWTSRGCSSANISTLGAVPTSGSVSTPKLTQTKTYTLTASNANNTVKRDLTVVVNAPTPACSINSFNLSPSQGYKGTQTSLSWSHSNCTYVQLSGGQWGSGVNAGTAANNGATSNPINQTTLYTLFASNSNNTTYIERLFTVIPPPTPTGFSATGTACPGDWINLSWNASNSATNYKVYRKGVLVHNAGSTFFSDTGLTRGNTYTYELLAENDTGQSSRTSVSIYFPPCPPPDVFDFSISASNVTIKKGPSPVSGISYVAKVLISNPAQSTQYTSITGLPSGVSYSFASDPCTPNCNPNITLTVPTNARVGDYPITVYSTTVNYSPVVSRGTTFNLTIQDYDPDPATASLSASSGTSPSSPIPYGGSTSLNWSSTNATGCTASGEWSGNKNVTGTQSTGGLASGPHTYSISCSGSAVASVTVFVGDKPAACVINTLTANPSSIYSGQTTTLNWTSANCTNGFLSGGQYGSGVGASLNTYPNNGANTSPIYETTTYTLTGDDGINTSSKSVTVTVGQPATLNVYSNIGSNWSISPAGISDSVPNGGWSEEKSYTVYPSAGGTIYSISGGNISGYNYPPDITNTVNWNGNTLTLFPGRIGRFYLEYTQKQTPFNYTLSNSGDITIKKGNITQYGQNTVSKTLSPGSPAEPVSLSVSGHPSGVTLSISNQGCSPTCSSVINFSAQPSARTGTYKITVTGSPLNRTTTFDLVIEDSPAIVATCAPSNSTPLVGTEVSWSAKISGGVPPYTFYWIGTNIPTVSAPTISPYKITYSTVGQKTAQVMVTDSLENTGSCIPGTLQVRFDPKFEEI